MTYKPRFHASRRSVLKGTGAAFIGLTMMPYKSMAQEEKKLNFYNWDTYIGENTLDEFNKASGIEVKMDLYADNDELFAKLKEGNPGYDVIVPTNDMVERMIKAGMLDMIDRDIELAGPLDIEQKARLLEIADKCPVHRTLERTSTVTTTLA